MFTKHFDLISMGDTQYDVFLQLREEVKVMKDESDQKNYLGLVFAEKIPVEKLTRVPAVGNSANVAIGASRLGLKTALYTYLGNDEVADEELAVFRREKVATDYILRDKARASNFSAVLNYKEERTILVYHEHRDYELPPLAPAGWAYFSSLAPGHEKLHVQIPSYVKKYGVKLGFNPGSYQLKEGIKTLAPILAVTHALFVNKEEAQTLVGREDDTRALAAKLMEHGPRVVVITDGPNGSYAFDGQRLFYLEIFPAPMVERTGAGDAYATGFVCALSQGHPVEEAMRWGTFNSASVIQKIGAREGLLTKSEMSARLKANPMFRAKIVS